jgi:putative transposase
MSPEEIAMRKARFTEHQIITVLKSVETGRTVKDVCREAGISEGFCRDNGGRLTKVALPVI